MVCVFMTETVLSAAAHSLVPHNYSVMYVHEYVQASFSMLGSIMQEMHVSRVVYIGDQQAVSVTHVLVHACV